MKADEPVRRSGLRLVDAVLIALGVAFGSISLFYPFGRDQGLYYYVGREWALHGAVPYRDVFDHKTPAIYILHAGLVRLLGDGLWPIRVAELAAIVAVGFLAARLARPSNDETPPGFRGLGVLIASVFYYGFFDFRETGEGEIWLALLGLASVAAVRDVRRDSLAYPLAGASAAAAILMKPSAIWFVFLATGMLVMRARAGGLKAVVRALVLFGGGSVAVVAPILAYFGAKHAFPAMHEILVVANGYYVRHESGVDSLGDIIFYHKWFFDWVQPFALWVVAGLLLVIVRARRASDRATGANLRLVLLLLFVSWAGVAMQLKFYLGHWGVMVPAATVATLSLFYILQRDGRGYWGRAVGTPACAAIFLALFAITPSRFVSYVKLAHSTADYALGHIDWQTYGQNFVEHASGARASDNIAVAEWIRDHTSPSDFIAVRGFQPQIYAFAHRRYPGRFYWTSFMVSKSRAVKGPEWLAEDRRALASNPPRIVVTIAGLNEGNTDCTDWWLPFGYTKRTTIGDFDVLERTPETATEQL
ncbi:MAG: glycosyltransferase family 39 protein [Polyangiaceae bacterium]